MSSLSRIYSLVINAIYSIIVGAHTHTLTVFKYWNLRIWIGLTGIKTGNMSTKRKKEKGVAFNEQLFI